MRSPEISPKRLQPGGPVLPQRPMKGCAGKGVDVGIAQGHAGEGPEHGRQDRPDRQRAHPFHGQKPAHVEQGDDPEQGGDDD